METIETGISFYKEGKFDAALAVFNQLIVKEGKVPAYLHYRARIQSRLGALEEALMDFDTLLELDTYNTTYISDKAVVLHLLDRNHEAKEGFDQALNLDPNNPYRYSSRAYFRDRIGDLNGAIADYEKAIELDPEDAVAHNNKGIVEEKLAGYQAPESNESALPKIDNAPQNTIEEPIKEQEGLNLQAYFKVLTNVFTDKETRAEFISFIKTKFKRS